jgi:exodeoxyribonuclease VII large subunit
MSVAELTFLIQGHLETFFPDVWVVGEISNFSRAGSGHCYLTLKDDQAQLSAVLWRSTASRVKFDLHVGLEVLCRGAINVYAPRGTYQLVIEQIQPRGLGALELALKQLKAKLEAEGLFDPARKRPLPRFPRRVAVVTSPAGAAIRDVLEVARRRWQGTDVLIVPARVQGEGAAAELAAAIVRAGRLSPRPDCLVVTRGGGSLEDLWAFNEEAVVRAIAASRIPTVCGVGHEIDVTLSDLAADVRALTPSEAAERVFPDAAEIAHRVAQHQRRLVTALKNKAAAARSRLDALASSRCFRRPAERLHERLQRLDELSTRGLRSLRERFRRAKTALEAQSCRLESLSPLAVLKRGYSVTTRVSDGGLVTRAAHVTTGDVIRTRLAEGEVQSRVE